MKNDENSKRKSANEAQDVIKRTSLTMEPFPEKRNNKMRTLPEFIGCISRIEGLDNTEDEHSLNRSSDGGHWSMSSQQGGWRESKAEEDRGRQRKTEQDRERFCRTQPGTTECLHQT